MYVCVSGKLDQSVQNWEIYKVPYQLFLGGIVGIQSFDLEVWIHLLAWVTNKDEFLRLIL